MSNESWIEIVVIILRRSTFTLHEKQWQILLELFIICCVVNIHILQKSRFYSKSLQNKSTDSKFTKMKALFVKLNKQIYLTFDIDISNEFNWMNYNSCYKMLINYFYNHLLQKKIFLMQRKNSKSKTLIKSY